MFRKLIGLEGDGDGHGDVVLLHLELHLCALRVDDGGLPLAEDAADGAFDVVRLLLATAGDAVLRRGVEQVVEGIFLPFVVLLCQPALHFQPLDFCVDTRYSFLEDFTANC